MRPSIRTFLSVILVTLAVPAAALASSHRHARFAPPLLPPAAATVTDFTAGALTLGLPSGGSVTGAVTGQTRFICIGAGFGRGRGFTPQPPCDSSRLALGQGVLAANVQITSNGVQFSVIVLLPAVQTPVTT